MASHRPNTRCPAVMVPDVTPCDPAELTPLLHGMADTSDRASIRTFPRGALLDAGTRVDLCKQSIGPNGARALIDALPNAPEVDTILLGTGAIGDRGAADVGGYVQEHKDQLRTVYLGCNRITARGVADLAKGLRGSKVRALWLKRNPIGPDGARALLPLLEPPHGIEVLDLFNTELGDAGIEILHSVLDQPGQTLRYLYLGGNGIGPRGAMYLRRLLPSTNALRGLYLPVNQLGDLGSAILGDGLGANRGLEDLSLGSNGIQTADSLVNAAAQHPTLRRLGFERAPSTHALAAEINSLGNAATEGLAKMLEQTRTLESLNLSHNGITSRGALTLLASLQSNSSLRELRIGKHVSRRIKARIRTCRARNAAGNAAPIQPPEHVRAILSYYRT